jgi:hypothetical protein
MRLETKKLDVTPDTKKNQKIIMEYFKNIFAYKLVNPEQKRKASRHISATKIEPRR